MAPILAALLVLAGVLVGCGAQEPDRGRDRSGTVPGVWDRVDLPAGTAVRLGEEIVSVSGGGYNNDWMIGFALDLGSERSRRLPRVPLTWRAGYSVVGTGQQAIVWGGSGGLAGAQGARFDGASGRWSVTAQSPLRQRYGHTAIWTGDQMLVWGGETGNDCGGPTPRSGAAYDPETDSWRRIAKAPIGGRIDHTAVWTGKRMLIWGGTTKRKGDCEPTSAKSDGAAFDPKRDRWTSLPRAPIKYREDSDAVWTGQEMLVWNGIVGAAYRPDTNSWRSIRKAPIDKRINEVTAWTGDELLIWGGIPNERGAHPRADGAAYDPELNRWSMLPSAPRAAKGAHSGFWAAGSMFALIGGCCDNPTRSVRFTPALSDD